MKILNYPKMKDLSLVILIFLCRSLACSDERKVYDSDLIDQKQASQKYSGKEETSSVQAFATFAFDQDVVNVVALSRLLMNGELVSPKKQFGQQKNKGLQYPNGIGQSNLRNVAEDPNEIVFEYTNNDGEKFKNKVDLRQIDLKLPPNAAVQSNQELKIEYENPSNAEVYGVWIGIFDEEDSRRQFYGTASPTNDVSKTVIYIDAKKLIIPPSVWEKGKLGKNNLPLEFKTRMPLVEGEKGIIEYD